MPDSNTPGAPEVAALLAEREHLRAVLRMMPVGVSIVDARGQLVEANPTAESIWGPRAPRVELEDYGFFEGYWPGSDRRLEPHEWALARTLRDGQPVANEEVDVIAFDGTRRTLLNSTTPLRDAQGAILGAVAVHVDITTRRQAEHAEAFLAEAFLAEATRLLVESLDWESTLQAVARLATRHLAEGCIIDVLGDDGELHRLAVAAREPSRDALLREALRYPPKVGGTSPVARVFTEGRSLLLQDITPEHLDVHARDPEHRRLLEALAARACMAVPLALGERRLGVINFVLYTPGRRYTERELGYAEELARRAAFVVEHARLYREAQGALRARDTSLALLEAFLSASPVGMGFIDRELRYVHVNPVLATINGKPREAHLGRRVNEVLPELEESERIAHLLRGVMESGEPRLSWEGVVPPRAGLPPRPVRASFFPVKVEGETLGLGGIVLDETERKRVEADLRFLAEATTRMSTSLDLGTTLESTARMVAEHLADYCLVDLRTEDGQGLTRVVAVAREPGSQPLLEEALRASPVSHPQSPILQVLESGRALLVPEVTEVMLDEVSIDARHQRVLEHLRPRSVMVVPLIARERSLGVLTVVSQDPLRRYTKHDLTLLEDLARRAALAVDNARLFRRAEQAVRERDDFVAMATHELRTPLSALSLQLAALQRSVDTGHPPTPERLHQSLVTAQRQTERLERLVNDLLDVSRISTGQLHLEPEEVELSAMVHWLVTRFEDKLAEAGVVAEVHTAGPVVARVDRLRVEQVLMNLLSNAAKYAPGLPVELRLEREERWVALSVMDHGPGISPEAQARIFEPYQRASGKHSRHSLGLGLYVARQIARAHGGELTVASTPGQGCRFTLRLPLDTVPGSEPPR
ncbi:MAG TPA: GAF domain-containing protein [Archangium sp.]|uniref:sensor histidine kinase n=1 Tax=Archangium sp. TaxID=1872627 RepID=UPI002ED89196